MDYYSFVSAQRGKSNNEIKSELSEENMRRLTKKYMLDLGSANVYDLTMF